MPERIRQVIVWLCENPECEPQCACRRFNFRSIPSASALPLNDKG